MMGNFSTINYIIPGDSPCDNWSWKNHGFFTNKGEFKPTMAPLGIWPGGNINLDTNHSRFWVMAYCHIWLLQGWASHPEIAGQLEPQKDFFQDELPPLTNRCVCTWISMKKAGHMWISRRTRPPKLDVFFCIQKTNQSRPCFVLLTTKPPILGFLFQPTNLSHPFPNVSGPTNSSDQFSRPQNMLTVFPMGSWKITAVLNMLIRWWTT